MEIQITDNYKIETVPLNYVLYERRDKIEDGEPTGEFTWVNVAYCVSFEFAINKIIEKEQHRMDVSDLEEFLITFDGKKREIINALHALDNVPELPDKREKEAE